VSSVDSKELRVNADFDRCVSGGLLLLDGFLEGVKTWFKEFCYIQSARGKTAYGEVKFDVGSDDEPL